MNRLSFTTMSLLAAMLLVSCGSGNKSSAADEAVTQSALEPANAAPTPDLSKSKCHGNRVPPTNYLQETAFVRVSEGGTEEAKRMAMQQLRDRICQGYRCQAIEPKISHWHTEQDAVQVCAMAVVKASDVEEFKQAPRRKLDDDLQTRAAMLVKQIKQRKGEPRIAFDNVRDVGVDGGPRAEWLVDRMAAALSKNGALIARVPADWSGLGLPKGVDAVLRARITPMHGQESMLEVTWNLDLGIGIKAVDPIAFPELIGPAINPLTQLPDLAGINPAVSLRFDARPGGGLCNGQTTELRLETGEDLHVRVVNLFGEGDRGILIHSTPDALNARTPTSLGQFQVVKADEVPVERFLVMGAKSKSELGPLANAKLPCRLPSDFAKQLSSGRGIPSGAAKFTTSRSYRIVEGAECNSFSPQEMPDDWYDALPACF